MLTKGFQDAEDGGRALQWANTFPLSLQVQVLFRDKWALNKLKHHRGH